MGGACPQVSRVREESQVFISERHSHVDDTAGLRTETRRTLRGRKTGEVTRVDLWLNLRDYEKTCGPTADR